MRERERESEGYFGHFRKETRVSGGGRIFSQTLGEVIVIFEISGVLGVLKVNLRGGKCNSPNYKRQWHSKPYP